MILDFFKAIQLQYILKMFIRTRNWNSGPFASSASILYHGGNGHELLNSFLGNTSRKREKCTGPHTGEMQHSPVSHVESLKLCKTPITRNQFRALKERIGTLKQLLKIFLRRF